MILIAGPFVGNFEQEIITFRPWLMWLMLKSSPEKIYVNTHKNRSFLYHFAEILPVYEHISRNEIGQIGYTHTDVDNKLFQTMSKDIKNDVCKIENCSKKDIEIHNLSYVKSNHHISIYNKIYSPIKVAEDIENPYKGKILFIPASTEKRDFLSKVKRLLREYHELVIVGDTRTRFKKQNVILSMIDYYENGFKLLIKMISEAKAVICPISYWTTICNLQQIPVFSWGPNVGQYREDGIYLFNNKKCVTFPSNDNIKVVLHMIENFLEDVYNDKL